MNGICFIEPLFLATIEGRKTKTRRIINPQPICLDGYSVNNGRYFGNPVGETGLIKPRYKVGEIVYLREPYRVDFEKRTVFFKFSNKTVDIKLPTNFVELEKIKKLQERSKSGFVNKLFVPKWINSYFLNRIKITDVRCERLQDISDEDCLKEGIKKDVDFTGAYACYYNGLNYTKKTNGVLNIAYSTPQESFSSLIDKINGRGAWESNPYVWVYSYELIKSFDEILEDNKHILKRLKNS